MSTVVSLSARDLKSCFSAISLVAMKGSQLTPVSLILKNNKLQFICLQGCVAQCSILVASDEIANLVFMYYDVTPIIPPSGDVDVTLSSNGVSIEGEGFSCTFPKGYSDVTEFDFSNCKFTPIESDAYMDAMKNMMGMSLDKLYGTSVPVDAYQTVSVMKYPCCYVQTRTHGFPVTAQIDPEHMKMLIRFAPKEVSESIKDTLVFRKGTAMLQVPCRTDIPENDFLQYLSGLSAICRIDATGLYDKVKNASRLSNKSRCRIFVYKAGFKVVMTIGEATSSVSVGESADDLPFTAVFPIQVLLAFLRAIGNQTMEILAGGELLCLRTQSLIILVRVEY